jgi:putative transposase
MYCRNRTPSEFIGYGLYLYFLDLSFRNAAIALKWFIKISHVSIWKWIQKYKPKKIFTKKKRKIDGYIIDETLIKVGSSEYIWLWVIIEPNDKEILAIDISKERNMFVARAFSITYCKRIWSTFCFN